MTAPIEIVTQCFEQLLKPHRSSARGRDGSRRRSSPNSAATRVDLSGLRRTRSVGHPSHEWLRLEQSSEVLDFLRDKFTAHELYLWLQKETAALYHQMYELAYQTAQQAQKAFNFELGHLTEDFVGGDHWDDLHEGLLAGERLMAGLRRMEKAYTDLNRREYELTKQVSLRELFPLALLELRLTGRCELELPEWLFDLDYPGHYLRRVKNVSLTIPSVLGPLTGVHCRLTLLSSETRIDPRLRGPLGRCCDTPRIDPDTHTCGCCGHVHEHHGHEKALRKTDADNGYPAIQDDPRFVKLYGAKEAITTSTAQDDTGLFELNFRDERYLPFEFHGALSRWRIELPPENNYFDLSTITDLILQLRYTAREGGDVLRRAALETTRKRLPDAGLRIVDVRQELPAAWSRLQTPPPDAERQTLEIEVERDWFPFLPGKPTVHVTQLEFFFEVAEPEPCQHCKHEHGVHHEHEHSHHEEEHEHTHHEHHGHAHHEHDHHARRDCTEPAELPRAKYTLHVTLPEKKGHSHDAKCGGNPHTVHAVASAEWPGVYHGVLDVRLGPITNTCGGPRVTIEFPRSVRNISSVFVVLGYETERVPALHRGITHAGP